MVGDRARRQMTDTVREAAAKAGNVVTAAFAIAGAALVLAVAVLVLALRTRARVMA